jgi:tetratricopeptide (TPR) repeat protein
MAKKKTPKKSNKEDIRVTETIEIDSDSAFAHYNRGLAYYRESKYQLAIDCCSKAIKIDKNYADAYYVRGLAYYDAGADFIACAEIVIAAHMGHELAQQFVKDKGWEWIKLEMDKKKCKPSPETGNTTDDAYSLIKKGLKLFDEGEYEEAIDNFNKAIGINPEIAEAYAWRGLAYAELDMDEQANKDLKKAARMGDEDAEEYLSSHDIDW